MASPSVYIETTIISYLTARPSNDLNRAAQQRSTYEWWDTQRPHFDLFTSELVILEASAGDPAAAGERLAALAGILELNINAVATGIADALLKQGAVPRVAARDALHVGICAANGVNYLLTWNFRHLANAVLRDRISGVCVSLGYKCPVICTTDELSEDRA